MLTYLKKYKYIQNNHANAFKPPRPLHPGISDPLRNSVKKRINDRTNIQYLFCILPFPLYVCVWPKVVSIGCPHIT